MKHSSTVTLETDRLILRRFTIEDAEAVYKNWASDDEVTKYLTWQSHKSVSDSRAFMDYCVNGYESPDFYQWGIELKATRELIGNISVVHFSNDIDALELGWVLGKAYWGNGFMPEAAKRVINYLFDKVGANCIYARHDVNNPKSGRVMQKAGMKFEGILRQSSRNNQGIADMARYSILNHER